MNEFNKRELRIKFLGSFLLVLYAKLCLKQRISIRLRCLLGNLKKVPIKRTYT